jgi:hypothetical protein
MADHDNVIDQHRHDVEDIKGAARMFVAFIKEQVAEAEPIALPSAATSEMLEGHKSELADRNAAFKREASDLCARDDVSHETVALARDRFNDLVEAKLGEFALERQAMLDKALDHFKADKAWKAEILALSGSAGDAPAFAVPGMETAQ